jgi:hypothetical protein
MDKRDAKADLAAIKSIGPLRAVSKQVCGLGHTDVETCGYATVISADGEEVIRDCWGDDENGGRPYFQYIPNKLAMAFATCPDMVEHWINRAAEAEGREDALIEEIQHLRDDVETLRSALCDAVEALDDIKGFATRRPGMYTADFLDGLLEETVEMLTAAIAKAKEALA